MGSRQTKFEEEILNKPASQQPNAMDPRSPNGQRTPINLPTTHRVDTLAQLVPVDTSPKSSAENPLDILRRRFLKGFTYNMNDPRSPSLNRTPLIFEDSDKTLNLDDTFADLFVESNVPDQVEESNSCNDFEMAECTQPSNEMVETSIPRPVVLLQQQFDPRSPSGVERTPIIFNDDGNETNEDVILENILTSLTLKNLNISGSSVVSIKSSDVHKGEEENEIIQKPNNKYLDRLRVGNKAVPKGPHRRQKRVLRQKIYEDRENQLSLTPQLKKYDVGVDSPKMKRTPLSCVRNCSQIRSRSVESTAKSVKTRLPIMSFDDTLNPNENKKVPMFRGMHEGSFDSVL